MFKTGFRNWKMENESQGSHSGGSQKKGDKSGVLDNHFGDRRPDSHP